MWNSYKDFNKEALFSSIFITCPFYLCINNLLDLDIIVKNIYYNR